MILIPIMAAAVAVASPQGKVPQGFVPLTPSTAADRSNGLCAPDGQWCVTPPEPEDPNIYVDKGPQGESYWSPPEGDGSNYAMLPVIAPLKAGGAFLIMTATRRSSYSGGGGLFEDYVLIHVAPTGETSRILTVPQSGSLTIRACFNEKDEARRSGACHDEYELKGTIALVDDGSPMPAIQYSTAARSYPRGVSRSSDSLALPPLRQRDLAWTTDTACTYQRTFTYSSRDRQYLPNEPIPGCGQYLGE